MLLFVCLLVILTSQIHSSPTFCYCQNGGLGCMILKFDISRLLSLVACPSPLPTPSPSCQPSGGAFPGFPDLTNSLQVNFVVKQWIGRKVFASLTSLEFSKLKLVNYRLKKQYLHLMEAVFVKKDFDWLYIMTKPGNKFIDQPDNLWKSWMSMIKCSTISVAFIIHSSHNCPDFWNIHVSSVRLRNDSVSGHNGTICRLLGSFWNQSASGPSASSIISSS